MSDIRQQPDESSPEPALPQLEPALAPVPSKSAVVIKRDEPQWEEVREGWRETFETISFVVFLVLMLKAFVAEAYVIPTGSMAITLLGDHMFLQCPRCEKRYAVNASNNGQHLDQVPGAGGKKLLQLEGCCPNCQYVISNPAESVEGGDKVLVLKPIFDLFKPRRHDTVVFKYPLGPQKDFGAYNYIKRLWGLPGEKLAIWGGDVYLVENDKLNIIRKAPDKMLHMRRLVNDNQLLNPNYPEPWMTSWKPANERWEMTEARSTSWQSTDSGKVWISKTKPGEIDWLRYHHQFTPARIGGGFAGGAPPIVGPHLITNFEAYNHMAGGGFPHDWVGDLMVESEVEVQAAKGLLIFQLKKGVLNTEAQFNLETGKCTVVVQKQGKEISKQEANSKVNSLGRHLIRFANFDHRLTVWVNSTLLFGEGVEIAPLSDLERGPRLADLVPVSIGAKEVNATLRKLSVWRDIYYSRDPRRPDAQVSQEALAMTFQQFQELAKQGDLHSIERTAWLPYYPEQLRVNNAAGTMGQPQFYPTVDATHPSDHFNADEYFMLGDNSLASQDSRYWGQVPQRMLLGQAIWVYWPFRNFSSIR